MDINIKGLSIEQCDVVIKQIEEQKKALLAKSRRACMEESFLKILNSGLVLQIANGIIEYKRVGDKYKDGVVLRFNTSDKEAYVGFCVAFEQFVTTYKCGKQEMKEFFSDMFATHLNFKGYSICANFEYVA